MNPESPRPLDPIFAPRSVAVVGASRSRNSLSFALIDNMVRDEFNGAIFPVNPNAQVIHSFKCYPSMAAVPDPVNELPLFAAQDCRACHRTSVNLVGPAYAAIAARYEPTDANVGLLVSRIIGGSEGVWGETPMTPHPMLVPATAREMVAEILGLAP